MTTRLDKDDFGKEQIELIVPSLPADSGALRLDAYVAWQIDRLSRTRVQKLIDQGLILVDSKRVKVSHRLAVGERIDILIPADDDLDVVRENIPLDLLYEDEFLAVVNKPAGMVTHPGAGVTTGTLVNALLYHMHGTLSGIGGVIRPGIVHRLDKDTSGLLVVAKEDFSHQNLAQQILSKSARRIYIALIAGNVCAEEGVINKPIGRHPIKRKQMAVVESGRNAVSRYKVLQRLGNFTLVEVRLETGRTHQIRVHMASIGHPVVGDLLYNKGATGTLSARARLGLKGHMLHSAELSFRHPRSGCLLEFKASLPADFASAIERLR